MNDTLIISLGTLINAIIVGVATAIITVLNARHKNESASKAQEFTDQGKIIDRQEKHIARLDEQVSKQQESLDRVHERLNRSLTREAQMRVFMNVLLDALHKAKIAIDIPPELLNPHDEDEDDFEAKTQAQNTLLLKAESQKLREGHRENPGN